MLPLALVVLLAAPSLGQDVSFFSANGSVARIREGDVGRVLVSGPADVQLRLAVADAFNARLLNASRAPTIAPDANATVEVRGLFVGKTWLLAFGRNGTGEEELARFPLHILRTKTNVALTNVFAGVMALMTIVNTFIMGLQLDWKVILEVFKRPVAPLIGFCCQYLLMPPMAFGWGSLLLRDPALWFGYFAVGCSPGGGPSNAWTVLLHGNLDLSVAMTFVSNVAALAAMPAWIYSLGSLITDRIQMGEGEGVVVPFANLVGGLAALILPVTAGIVVAHFRPHWREPAKAVIKISSALLLLIALPLGVYANLFLFSLITWRTIVCGFLLPWCGFGLAFGAAKAFRRDLADAKTIAIETGIQNAGVAVVLLRFSLPEPEGDLAMVLPVCVLLLTPLPLLLTFCFQCSKDCFAKKNIRHRTKREARRVAREAEEAPRAEDDDDTGPEVDIPASLGKAAGAKASPDSGNGQSLRMEPERLRQQERDFRDHSWKSTTLQTYADKA